KPQPIFSSSNLSKWVLLIIFFTFPCLSCELNIIQARNIELKSSHGGNLFVRYYLSTGNNNNRIQLNSQEVPCSKSIWNERFSLECQGTEDAINKLKQDTITLELRWRKTVPVLGKLGKSRVLARAEIPWRMVLESQNMEMAERWVVMVAIDDRILKGGKPPLLQIAVKVEEKMVESAEKKKKNKRYDEGECGCRDGDRCSCAEYELFALMEAMNTL
ncbi:uncharacterized protein LOC110806507, partial [Carica papaya]|uniref:uncharacterized protein LOC110806507 n=1 Tax=Carica papaya TaxID=3649 RepID=UPI000B8CDC6F